MKPVTAFLLSLLLCLSFALGGFTAMAEEPSADQAWRAAEEPALNEDLLDAFAQATEGLLGVKYEPLVVSPEAKGRYAIVQLRQTEKGCELIDITALAPNGQIEQDPIPAEGLVGGWSVPEDEQAGLDAFAKATEGLLGVEYTPLCVLGQQLVAGMNYCVLCRGLGVYPDAQPCYTLAVVYAALDGSATVTRWIELDGSGLPAAPECITIDGQSYALQGVDGTETRATTGSSAPRRARSACAGTASGCSTPKRRRAEVSLLFKTGCGMIPHPVSFLSRRLTAIRLLRYNILIFYSHFGPAPWELSCLNFLLFCDIVSAASRLCWRLRFCFRPGRPLLRTALCASLSSWPKTRPCCGMRTGISPTGWSWKTAPTVWWS